MGPHLRELRDDDTERFSVESTCVRAAVAVAGVKKADSTGGQAPEVFGRSRGGFGSKLHGV